MKYKFVSSVRRHESVINSANGTKENDHVNHVKCWSSYWTIGSFSLIHKCWMFFKRFIWIFFIHQWFQLSCKILLGTFFMLVKPTLLIQIPFLVLRPRMGHDLASGMSVHSLLGCRLLLPAISISCILNRLYICFASRYIFRVSEQSDCNRFSFNEKIWELKKTFPFGCLFFLSVYCIHLFSCPATL